MVVHVDGDSFEKEVLKSDKTVVVDFYADWCGPCKMLSPIIEEVSKDLSRLKFVKFDTETAPEIAAKYNVMSIPTLIVFKKGHEEERLVGYMTKAVLKEKLAHVVA